MALNEKCDLILDVLRKSDEPLKISDIQKILKFNGHNISHDAIVNYFWGENYRLVDMMDKIHPYKYQLKKPIIKRSGTRLKLN